MVQVNQQHNQHQYHISINYDTIHVENLFGKIRKYTSLPTNNKNILKKFIIHGNFHLNLFNLE